MRFLLNPISGQLNAAPPKEIVYSDTAPFAPLEGLRWADTTNLREYIFTDGVWVEVGAGLVGPTGPQGVQGDKGDAATLTVGTTSTGAAGTSATVTNSGTLSAAVLDFAIPKGDKGDKGDDSTILIGTTTTAVSGTPASVVNSGSASAAVLNFTIPKGDTGQDGTSIVLRGAVSNFGSLPTSNTIGDVWVTSDTGDGYAWSGSSWSNVGRIQGPPSTVSAGTTTTGVAGTNASVTNSGLP